MTTKAPAETTAAETIHTAMLAIYQEGKLYAQKASRNTAQSYNYTSEADFLALIRPQLAAHGIICFPSYEVVSESLTEIKAATERDNAKFMRRVTVRGTFTYYHAPSGTELTVVTIGEGCDGQDKAPYKAMTGALKYAVRQAFQIETGDDPENDTADTTTTTTDTASKPPNFSDDFGAEVKRLGTTKVHAILAAMFPTMSDGTDLRTLSGPEKRAVIQRLRLEPGT